MELTVSGEGLASQSITINTENRAGEDKYLESYDIVKNYYVALGEKPELPKTVEGRYSDGTTANFNIEWNAYDEEILNTPQIVKLTGKLEGTDIAVVVNVHIIGDVVAMENYSTFTYSGTVPSLPKTVKGYLVDGGDSEDFVVNWDLEGKDFTNVGETVVINGKVQLLGKEYPVTASVRIVEALKNAANISINNETNNDIPKLSQSCTKTSDNLDSINNGIKNNSSNTNERWTNWGERELTVDGEPKGAYVQLDWSNKHAIDRLDLWLFTDNGAAKLPKKVEIRYKNDA